MKKQTIIKSAALINFLVATTLISACGSGSTTSATPAKSTTGTDQSTDTIPSVAESATTDVGGGTATFVSLSDPLQKGALPITRNFGYLAKFNGMLMTHLGTDINGQTGDLVYSPVTGKVVAVLSVGGYGSDGTVNGEVGLRKGWVILIQAEGYNEPFVIMLGHVTPSVVKGQVVQKGDNIGTLAYYAHVFNGQITADWAHLHLGVRNGAYGDGGNYVIGYSNGTENTDANGGRWHNPLTFNPAPATQVGETLNLVELDRCHENLNVQNTDWRHSLVPRASACTGNGIKDGHGFAVHISSANTDEVTIAGGYPLARLYKCVDAANTQIRYLPAKHQSLQSPGWTNSPTQYYVPTSPSVAGSLMASEVYEGHIASYSTYLVGPYENFSVWNGTSAKIFWAFDVH